MLYKEVRLQLKKISVLTERRAPSDDHLTIYRMHDVCHSEVLCFNCKLGAKGDKMVCSEMIHSPVHKELQSVL